MLMELLQLAGSMDGTYCSEIHINICCVRCMLSDSKMGNVASADNEVDAAIEPADMVSFVSVL